MTKTNTSIILDKPPTLLISLTDELEIFTWEKIVNRWTIEKIVVTKIIILKNTVKLFVLFAIKYPEISESMGIKK